MKRFVMLVCLLSISLGAARAQSVIWVEAEAGVAAAGKPEVIDASTSDYGAMAKSDASGGRFIRISPGTRLTYPAMTVHDAGQRTVWVRAFPMTDRLVTIVVNGRVIGTTKPAGDAIALTWEKVGTVDLTSGDHALELRAADGNRSLAYVDAVALLADPHAVPTGKDQADILTGAPVARINDDFADTSVDPVRERWTLRPPAGADAVIDMLPKEDDGAIHIHNGTGTPFSLTSRKMLDLKPGDQLTVRIRVRKGTLVEHLTVVVPGIGAFSPQLYRTFTNDEYTWLVPASATGPFVVQIVGGGGGDTYISKLEAFRRDSPVSAYETGRFLPAPNNDREGRLFEIERYVVNRDAFTDADKDGDGLWALCRISREENSHWFSRGTVLKSDSVRADRATPEEGCPPLHVRVGPLEPGPYQVYLNTPGRPLAYSTDGKAWRRLSGDRPPYLGRIEIKEPYFEFWLDDRYADPANPGPTYVDFIRFMPVEDTRYTMAPVPKMVPLAQSSVARRRVVLTVENPSDHDRAEPVRSGVPIPKGELASADQVRLLDERGTEVPAYVQTTGRWPDGSIKWLLLDFVTAVPSDLKQAHGRRTLTLEYGSQVKRAPVSDPFRITKEDHGLSVDTGAMRAVFDDRHGGDFTLLRRGQTSPALSLADVVFRTSDGREWRAALSGGTKIEVEERTPFRVVLRLRGPLCDTKGAGPLVFDTRIHLFANRPELLLEYGFVATAAEPTIPIAAASLRFATPLTAASARFGLETGFGKAIACNRNPRLLQTGNNAYGATGAFPFRLSTGGTTVASGERAGGSVQIGAGTANPLLLCVPHFWQQFPKAISCDDGGVTIDLWPKADDVEPFIAHAGAGKSHRICISLDAGAAPDRWTQPLFARCDPEWYCGSGAFEEMVPRRAGKYTNYETIIDTAFQQMLDQRAGYGMENWGDVWQEGYVPGAKTWSNQEWDLVNSWVIPFIRGGDARYLDFAHEAARHFADVDCIHYSSNPAFVGGSWMHAHTALRGHQLEPPNFAHAGWVEGMLNVYHLTGDRRGLEASEGIANYIARAAPERDSLPASGPPYLLSIQRPAGWPLTTLCLCYRETRTSGSEWNPVYLQTARRIVDYARRCQDPERGIWDAQVGHEVPYRGGCVFAYTLFRGLRLFADITGEERARRDYVSAARWIFGEMWRPGHLYLYEQCPLHEPGSRVPFILSEMAGYATRLSGDPIYVTIAHDAFVANTKAGAKSWMVTAARRSQWANGIVQQTPRLLYDWEATGLSTDDNVMLQSAVGRTKVPVVAPGEVRFLLHNGTDQSMTNLSASCLIRGDWKAEVVRCPSTVSPHGDAEVVLSCQAPPPLEQYELQNDLAHVHLLVRYEIGGKRLVAWSYARLDIAKPLEVTAPPAVVLKPGTATVAVLKAFDGVDPKSHIEAVANCDLAGVTVGAVAIAPTTGGGAAIRIPLSVGAKAESGTGSLTVTVRSGPRSATVQLPTKIGRFRVLLLESNADDEWRRPYDVLFQYPGIAVEYMPPDRIAGDFPTTTAGISSRWEAVVLGDTGKSAADFTPAQLQALAQFVRDGGGLMTIGGAHCYTPGGYGDTPLRDLLPVDMSDGSYAMGDIAVEVTAKNHVFFENYEPTLPHFGAHQLLRAKPGTQVLARFADGTPFVTLGTAGKGRVLSLGAIWNHGSGKAFTEWPNYGRFIGRCVRWTAGDLK